jgi:hypothetical protein
VGGAGVGSHGSGGGGGIEVGGGGGLGDGARRSQVTSCGRRPGAIVEAAKGGGDPPRVGVGGVRPRPELRRSRNLAGPDVRTF